MHPLLKISIANNSSDPIATWKGKGIELNGQTQILTEDVFRDELGNFKMIDFEIGDRLIEQAFSEKVAAK